MTINDGPQILTDDITVVSSRPSTRAPKQAPWYKRPILWISIACAIGVIGFLVIAASAKPSDQIIPPTPLVGTTAASIEGTDISGQPFSLESYRGSFVLVNFFATWCTECRLEHPELLKFMQSPDTLIPTKMVQLIKEDSVDKVSAFANTEGVNWPIVDDPNGALSLSYGVRGVPETFVIDPDGVILGVFRGPIQATTLRDAINGSIRQGLATS